ncbi:MAG: effector-associated domain EAD1-containing protein [Chloroflexota bacterium]|nr:effector-associated domain EAD1-containing protein [Chloroflexota bacterium]
MQFNPIQQKQLSKVLLAAFPTKNDLAQMVTYGLGENLNTLVGNGDLTDDVYDLIQWAIAEGCEEALIRAALAQNPTNPLLRAFADSVGIASHLPPPEDSGNVGDSIGNEQNLSNLSSIIITRSKQFKLVHADCSIYIDDKQVGEIEMGQVKQFDVTPGFHGVRTFA